MGNRFNYHAVNYMIVLVPFGFNEHVGFNYLISHFWNSKQIESIKRAAVNVTFNPKCFIQALISCARALKHMLNTLNSMPNTYMGGEYIPGGFFLGNQSSNHITDNKSKLKVSAQIRPCTIE